MVNFCANKEYDPGEPECGCAMEETGTILPEENSCPQEDCCGSAELELEIEGCGGVVTVDAAELQLEPPGHILQLLVTLRGVCPNKRVGLAVWLAEQDGCGRRTACGMRTVTVPAQPGPGCRDVVQGLQFGLPRRPDYTGAACAPRRLYVRMLANYLHADVWACCPCG